MKLGASLLALMLSQAAFAGEVAIRVEGVCFSSMNGLTYNKSAGIDFDVVSVLDSKSKLIAKVYVGTNPSVGKYKKYTFSEYRMKQDGPKIIDMGREGFLGVSNDFYQPHFHIFDGTTRDMRRVLNVVSFCK